MDPRGAPAVGGRAVTLAWVLVAVAVVIVPGRRRGVGGTSPRRPGPDRGLPLLLDLVAAGLLAGRPAADALDAAAPAGSPRLREAVAQVAGLLRLGASPERAWAALPAGSPLAPVVPVAIRSAASGLRLAEAFEGLAAELRAASVAAATARAHRAGVWAMAPLGVCFLPAFVCLGIVPTVVGIARTATGVLP